MTRAQVLGRGRLKRRKKRGRMERVERVKKTDSFSRSE